MKYENNLRMAPHCEKVICDALTQNDSFYHAFNVS